MWVWIRNLRAFFWKIFVLKKIKLIKKSQSLLDMYTNSLRHWPLTEKRRPGRSNFFAFFFCLSMTHSLLYNTGALTTKQRGSKIKVAEFFVSNSFEMKRSLVSIIFQKLIIHSISARATRKDCEFFFANTQYSIFFSLDFFKLCKEK